MPARRAELQESPRSCTVTGHPPPRWLLLLAAAMSCEVSAESARQEEEEAAAARAASAIACDREAERRRPGPAAMAQPQPAGLWERGGGEVSILGAAPRRWICFFMTLQLYPPMSGLVMRARVNCCLIMHSVRRSWQRR